MQSCKCGNITTTNPKLENLKVKVTGNEVKPFAGKEWNVKMNVLNEARFSLPPVYSVTQKESFCNTYRIPFGKATYQLSFDNLIMSVWGVTHSRHSDNDHKHSPLLLHSAMEITKHFPKYFLIYSSHRLCEMEITIHLLQVRTLL